MSKVPHVGFKVVGGFALRHTPTPTRSQRSALPTSLSLPLALSLSFSRSFSFAFSPSLSLSLSLSSYLSALAVGGVCGGGQGHTSQTETVTLEPLSSEEGTTQKRRSPFT